MGFSALEHPSRRVCPGYIPCVPSTFLPWRSLTAAGFAGLFAAKKQHGGDARREVTRYGARAAAIYLQALTSFPLVRFLRLYDVSLFVSAFLQVHDHSSGRHV